jgi:hypothetical protein
MEDFAAYAAPHSVLLSGGARGADQSFEFGARVIGAGKVETYLPWPKYEGILDPALSEPTAQALEVAEYYHPRWGRLSHGAKKLHGRNSHIILGRDLISPVDMVVCWTSDGKATGGTGQGIRIAEDNDIPVLNIQREADLEALLTTMDA